MNYICKEESAMDKWLYFVILVAAFCAVLYLLYRQGIMTAKSIQAILCAFLPGKNADRVALDSCTGWVRHIGRFCGGRIYEFHLDAQLSKGDAEVSLLDQGKRQLLKLDRHSPTGKIQLDGKSRYYLRWEFRDATGKCELHWLG